MEESNPELESFRQQWRAEVSAKTRANNVPEKASNGAGGPSKPLRRPPPTTRGSGHKPTRSLDESQETFKPSSSNLDHTGADDGAENGGEPRSALEHYEKAVERETAGSLGDSLNHYRKAFRLDPRVDQEYKNKHFPPFFFASKPPKPSPSNASVTVPNTAHHSLDGPSQTIQQLIAGFSNLKIESAPAAIEGTPAPPCPVAALPDEIMLHIFTEVAIMDVALFVRLAQVCRRMAYLVATEEQIWKRICLGSEFGFGAMHYRWYCSLIGGPLFRDHPDSIAAESDEYCHPPGVENETTERLTQPLLTKSHTTSLLHQTFYPSYQHMFQHRPRIRFNGCYISTVNYIRPGQASVSRVTWFSPVHIVTYYRYLRFFRDGSVISLLTTSEPIEVVHHLTKHLLDLHRDGAASHLPSSVMSNALRGRWRLSSIADYPEADLHDTENLKNLKGDIMIETEGVGPKDRYMYRMDLSLRSAGKAGTRNNKLVWKGYWNYNRLTDDWAEFALRNDKAFFWSPVKSYGLGV